MKSIFVFVLIACLFFAGAVFFASLFVEPEPEVPTLPDEEFLFVSGKLLSVEKQATIFRLKETQAMSLRHGKLYEQIYGEKYFDDPVEAGYLAGAD